MNDTPVINRIRNEISSNDVVLFMKGTPVFPQCGFSAAVVQVLNHVGVKFSSVDVLMDPEIRQGIKEFSNWPTVPQLYVKGEFLGGALAPGIEISLDALSSRAAQLRKVELVAGQESAY